MPDKRFKRIKKTIKPCYLSPMLLKETTGITAFSECGICLNEDLYSRVYFVEGNITNQFHEEIFKKIRELDLCLEFFKDINNENEYYITCYSYSNSFNEAIKLFSKIDNELKLVFSQYGIEVNSLNFNERMKVIHKIFAFAFIEEKSEVSDYLHDVNEWTDDFMLKIQYDFESDLKFFYAGKKYYKCCYIRSFTNNSVNLIKSLLNNNENIKYVKTCIQPVSDYMVAYKYKDTFLDYELGLAKVKRKDEILYNVLTNNVSSLDTRYFSLLSASFLLIGDSEEDVNTNFKNIQSLLLKKNSFLDFNYGGMFEGFSGIVPGCRPEMSQVRLFKSEYSSFVLSLKGEKVFIEENDVQEDNEVDLFDSLIMDPYQIQEEEMQEDNNLFDNLVIRRNV